MELGGIIAGALAGGGKAIQQNAQSQLKQQREEALQRLENEFAMGVAEYKQDRMDQRSAAEAAAEQAAAVQDAQLEIATYAANAATDAQMGNNNENRDLADVLEDRDRAVSQAVEAARDRRADYGLNNDSIDVRAVTQAVNEQYANLYPEYADDLMPSGSPGSSSGAATSQGRGGSFPPPPEDVLTDGPLFQR